MAEVMHVLADSAVAPSNTTQWIYAALAWGLVVVALVWARRVGWKSRERVARIEEKLDRILEGVNKLGPPPPQ
jgi:hypothetical protein